MFNPLQTSQPCIEHLSPQEMINLVGSEIRSMGGRGVGSRGSFFEISGRKIFISQALSGHGKWLLGRTVYDCSGHTVTAKDAITGAVALNGASISKTIRHLAALKMQMNP